jgi:K+-sensing histidine kinase KdpD
VIHPARASHGTGAGMIRRFHHWAAWLVTGSLILAVVTWACFQLGLNVATAGFGYLIVTTLLSLFDGFVSSVFFSIVALGCLDYFFMAPLFSFTVASIEDVMALTAFLIASITTTTLVRRSRRVSEALMDATAARRTDEELHKVQAELAHVIRVTTLGELAASLAHEITQPIAAARNNARSFEFLGTAPARRGRGQASARLCLGHYRSNRRDHPVDPRPNQESASADGSF